MPYRINTPARRPDALDRSYLSSSGLRGIRVTKSYPQRPNPSRIVVPRSAYGVFEFLGTIMKMQREHLTPSQYAYIPPNRPYVAEPPVLETVHEDPNLITVLQNLGGQCFVHTWFQDGDYCVPEEAATTKRIVSLLAQLIAIQTSANDLSITPIVRNLN